MSHELQQERAAHARETLKRKFASTFVTESIELDSETAGLVDAFLADASEPLSFRLPKTALADLSNSNPQTLKSFAARSAEDVLDCECDTLENIGRVLSNKPDLVKPVFLSEN